MQVRHKPFQPQSVVAVFGPATTAYKARIFPLFLFLQMLTDLNRVEFNNVHEQASWVCQCELTNVQSLEAEFKSTLLKQAGLGTKLYTVI